MVGVAFDAAGAVTVVVVVEVVGLVAVVPLVPLVPLVAVVGVVVVVAAVELEVVVLEVDELDVVALAWAARPANSPVPVSAPAKDQRVRRLIRRRPASRSLRLRGLGGALVMAPILCACLVRPLAAR